MDWLKPIQERLAVLASMRDVPSEEPTTVVDMLEADVRKLVALARMAEKEAGIAAWELYNDVKPAVIEARLGKLVACLRSGEVEAK